MRSIAISLCFRFIHSSCHWLLGFSSAQLYNDESFLYYCLKHIDSNSATYPALLTLGHFLLLICLRSHPLGLLCSKLRTKDRNKKKKREQTHHPLMLLPVLHCRSACLSLSSTMTLAVRVPSCFVRIRIHKTKRPTIDFLA